jgi:signal transduction histidine kinase
MSRETDDAGNISMNDVVRLKEVLGQDAVASVAKSLFALFGLPVRVVSNEGELVAEVDGERGLCGYLNTLTRAQRQCAQTLAIVRERRPGTQSIIHPCFSGAVYSIVPLSHRSQPIGRFIVGPYVPAETDQVPESLISACPADSAKARQLFGEMPRVRQDIAEHVCEHLKGVLELLVCERSQEVDEVERLKSTFLATVSHELRSPLTSIIGYAEMLQSGAAGALGGDQAEILATIRAKANELLGLISSLLDLGRLEAKALELQCEAVDPRALLAAVGSTIVPSANRKNVSLEIGVAAETPKIWGDPIRLRQILLNLAENAVKFTDRGGQVALGAHSGWLEGGGSARLGASSFAEQRAAVVLTVRDTGMGIAEDKLPRIFDAFYQVDAGTTRAHGGAGLGLSIVKQLVAGHGGVIEVTSTPGRGTLFTVTLPAAPCDA